MSLEVVSVTSKKDLIAFIKFPMKLYKGNESYVPPIIDFELSTLLSAKNPAFDHCEAAFWMVKKGQEVVGRVAGIIHNKELEEKKFARFGWIDFIDDDSVSALLMSTVSSWAVGKGASQLHGPLGFTDLDFEGSLISGFDQMATQATIYNAPYYHDHYTQRGFEKAVDWVEVRLHVPELLPRKLSKQAGYISHRFGFQVKEFRKAKEMLPYADQVFEVLNKAYQDLYGYYELSEKQIKYYVNQYFEFIRKEYICMVFDKEDKLAGMAICFPSLSKAFQKAKGSLFPFGFIHVLKSFRSNNHLDLFLIGVHPKHQKMGVHVLIFNELFSRFNKNKVKYVSTGPMLEENRSVLNLWNELAEYIDPVDIKRRCYTKKI